jgi:hypothetical protein
MGVRRIRLALRELEADDVRRRVTTLRKRGYEFQAYSYGRPGAAEHELVERDWDLLAGWELVLQLGEVDSVVAKLAALDLPCFLSELRDVDRSQVDDANVRHEANYGFQVHEPGKVEALCAAANVCKAFAGLVFRLRRRGEPRIAPWEGIREISRLGRESGLRHQAHIVFAGNLTAERLVDDLATANRVAEATLAAAAAGNVDLCLDTFEDVDRGYFVSHGLVDRRYNPRLAARVLRHLNAALARFGSGGIGESRLDELPAGRRLTLRRGLRLLIAALPSARLELSELGEQAPGQIDSVTLIDLDSGTLSEVAATTANGKLRLARPIKIDRPHLFVAG